MNENITDVEVIENEVAPVETHSVVSDGNSQVSQEQILQYLRMLRKQHNAKCRKPGFKDHIHQPSGHKLERKLERQGSLYGKVSIVGQTFLDMQTAKFKASKESVKNTAQTSTVPGTIVA